MFFQPMYHGSSKMVQHNHKQPKSVKGCNVLLVGPSQHGKSTLGNLLLTGKFGVRNQAFAVGNGRKSCTTAPYFRELEEVGQPLGTYVYRYDPSDGKENRGVKQTLANKANAIQTKIVGERKITGIRIGDTPGLGDTKGLKGDEQVLKGLIEMAEQSPTEMAEQSPTSQVGSICVVVKYDTVLDEQFFKNLEFYHSLYREAMINNSFLVCTNVPFPQRDDPNQPTEDELYYIREGLDPETKCRGLAYDIQRRLGIQLPVLLINSNPPPSQTRARQHALGVRHTILSSLGGRHVALQKMRIPKLPAWIQEDEAKILALQAGAAAFQDALESEHSNLATLNSRLQDLGNREADSDRKIAEAKAFIDSSNDAKQVWSRTYSDTWHCFRRAQGDVKITTTMKMSHVTVNGGWWSFNKKENGAAECFTDSMREFRDTVKNDYLKNMPAAVVRGFAKIKDIYPDRLEAQRRLYADEKQKKRGQQEERKTLLQDQATSDENFQLYSKKQQDRQAEIKKLKDTFISPRDALDRIRRNAARGEGPAQQCDAVPHTRGGTPPAIIDAVNEDYFVEDAW
jgi:hypothetical protein